MKVCTKCNSTYSDETLNFCLADGEPLVEGAATVQSFPVIAGEDWRDAETLLDQRIKITENERQTAPVNSAATLPSVDAPTQKFSTASNKTGTYLLAALLASVGLIAAYLWHSQGKNQAANTVTPAVNQAATVKPIVNLSADEQIRVKKEVTDTLEAWRKSNEDRDLEKHLDFYANTLDFFYKDSNVNKNYVRAARARAYEVFQTLSLQIDNLKITPESEASAIAVFDKDWTFKNPQKTTTGSVQQEIHLSKQNGKWLITAEKDLEVHFINNRTSETTETQTNTSNIQP